jgi:hypothetical protein
MAEHQIMPAAARSLCTEESCAFLRHHDVARLSGELYIDLEPRS